jgi:hypothetical protein
MNTYGTTGNVDYRSKIETIDIWYSFVRFGKYSSVAIDTSLTE